MDTAQVNELRTPGVTLIPSSACGKTLLRPDVVVLDISMPGMSGLDVSRRLCRAGSAVRVVFLTMHNEPELVEAAQAAGGIGYVLKARLSSDLTIAIAEALEGRRYVSRL